MTMSQLEQYVDGLSLTEIKKKKVVETSFKNKLELVNLIENLENDEYYIIPENEEILPKDPDFPLLEITPNKFWKTYSECRLILPESQKECKEIKLNPQEIIKRSLLYWKYRRNKESEKRIMNVSCRGISWRGISSLDTTPRILAILEVYRGLRVYDNDSVKVRDYKGNQCVGTIPSFHSDRPENRFRIRPLPKASRGDNIYEIWVNIIPYEETAGALFESTSQKYKVDEHRFTFGSIATLMARFLNKDLEDRLMLYPFPILNKKFIELHYKMANNVIVRYQSEGVNGKTSLKLKKLIKAEKENLNWLYVHNNNLLDLFLFGGNLKETTDVLKQSVAYSKEKV